MNEELHQKILERLEGDLRPYDFQLCVVDLWRSEYRLVPILGGNDGGMDGAIDDGQGDAFPLVATTGQRPVENLRKNLSSYRQRQNPRSRAAFASSRPLTAKTRDKLKAVATEHGILLEPIIDQAAVALRLVREPGWCRKLLGLSGAPSALSVVPPSRRTVLDIEPVGREADIEWLQGGSGDRVLAGQPGSGKTFLLHHLTKEGWGLFLIDDDPANLANALQEKQPKVVIVDDAHVDPTRLVRLRQFREDTHAEFAILAVTWEGAEPAVSEALGGLPAEKRRKLELMDRDELVEVIRRVGVSGPTELVRELVNQSANKPGLAVKLAQLTLAGDWRRIADGSALREDLVNAFRDLLGRDSSAVLACFSMGGEAGVSIDEVAAFFGQNVRELYEEASNLAAGGVLAERGEAVLAVEPEALRSSLLRHTFFKEPAPFPGWRRLFERVEDKASATEAIVRAVSRGAASPEEELRSLLIDQGSFDAWRVFVATSAERARWALEHFPGSFTDLAGPALRVLPEETIPRLLRSWAEGPAQKNSHRQPPPKILSEWVHELELKPGRSLGRRQTFMDAVIAFHASGGHRQVAMKAACLALSPARRSVVADPGDGAKVLLKHSILSEADIEQMEPLWRQAAPLLSPFELADWPDVSALLREWLYPETLTLGGKVSFNHRDRMWRIALLILRDIAKTPDLGAAQRSALERLANVCGETLDLQLDEDFELLYPKDSLHDGEWMEREAWHRERVLASVGAWLERGSALAARQLAAFEYEAEQVGFRWPRYTPLLAQGLAQQTNNVAEWLAAFIEQEVPGELVEPFLARMADTPGERWAEVALELFDHPTYSFWAMTQVLTRSHPGEALLKRSFEVARRYSHHVEILALRREIPLENLQELLRSGHEDVAFRAAIGEWQADDGGTVREELQEVWRKAIIAPGSPQTASNNSYWLSCILKADCGLGCDWLLARLNAQPDLGLLHDLETDDSPWKAAIEALDTSQRSRVLDALIPQSGMLEPVIRMLVGENAVLFRRLLARTELRKHHLAPLGGAPSDAWADLVAVAVESGFSANEITNQALWQTSLSSEGEHVEQLQTWLEVFSLLELNPRVALREVGRVGRQSVASMLEASKQQREDRLRWVLR